MNFASVTAMISRIVSGRPLFRRVKFEADYGLDGHSDADCLTHAICDALLGAAGLPDIGHFFPNHITYKNIDSQILLRRRRRLKNVVSAPSTSMPRYRGETEDPAHSPQ